MNRRKKLRWSVLGAMVVLLIEAAGVGVVATTHNNDRTDEYYRFWLAASRDGPLYHENPLELAEATHPTKEEGGARLDKTTTYGSLTLLHGAGGAVVVLAPNGTAVWAGNMALPVRYEGKVRGLLLLDEDMIPWGEWQLFSMSFLDFSSELPTWNIELPSHRFRITGDENTNGVVDIDGDGTDEIVSLYADQPDIFAAKMERRWKLVVYEQVRTTRTVGRAGLFDTSGKEIEYLELRVRLEAPLDLPAVVVDWKAPVDGKLRILDYSKGKGAEDSPPPSVIGTIARDKTTGKPVFRPE